MCNHPHCQLTGESSSRMECLLLYVRLTSIDGLEGLNALAELYLSHNLIESAIGLESQVCIHDALLLCKKSSRDLGTDLCEVKWFVRQMILEP